MFVFYGSRFKRYIAQLVAAHANKKNDQKRKNPKLVKSFFVLEQYTFELLLQY